MNYGLDIIGDIGIINFHERYLLVRKWLLARKILKENKNIKTVLEKRGQISGELRTYKTRHLTGERRKTTTHKENDCLFYMDVEKTYFSPRLSNERKIISEAVLKLVKRKKNAKILVMFAGVGPYPIAIAKLLKKNKIKAKIFSNELNADANLFAEKNVKLNKVGDYIEFVNGDANKLPEMLKVIGGGRFTKFGEDRGRELREGSVKQKSGSNDKSGKADKFDVILMPRPNIGETFLGAAMALAKKGTRIFYHGFGTEKEVLAEIRKDCGKKIGKIEIRKAGDIAPFKFRWQAEFEVK